VETIGSFPKAGSRSPPKDAGASSKRPASPSKKRRLVRGDGSTISGMGLPRPRGMLLWTQLMAPMAVLLLLHQ
jgi:hypothetical protein